jgi:hypothetical protein
MSRWTLDQARKALQIAQKLESQATPERKPVLTQNRKRFAALVKMKQKAKAVSHST